MSAAGAGAAGAGAVSAVQGDTGPAVLTVLFDGRCGMCTRSARIGRRIDRLGSVEYLAHQVPGVRDRFGITREQADYQIWAIDADGRAVGGAQAVAAILDASVVDAVFGGVAVRRLHPLERLATLPGIEQGLDVAYQWVARNRRRFPGMTPWCESHSGVCGR